MFRWSGIWDGRTVEGNREYWLGRTVQAIVYEKEDGRVGEAGLF